MKINVSRKFINFFSFLVIFFPFVIFISSFVLEYIFNFEPCNLCLVVRYIYLFLFISLLFFTQKRYITIMVALCGLLVSVYHKLMQMGYFSYCPSFSFLRQSYEKFQLMIQNAVPCSVKSSLFGFDFVWLNIGIFTVYTVFLIIRIWKITR